MTIDGDCTWLKYNEFNAKTSEHKLLFPHWETIFSALFTEWSILSPLISTGSFVRLSNFPITHLISTLRIDIRLFLRSMVKAALGGELQPYSTPAVLLSTHRLILRALLVLRTNCSRFTRWILSNSCRAHSLPSFKSLQYNQPLSGDIPYASFFRNCSLCPYPSTFPISRSCIVFLHSSHSHLT